MDSRGDRQMYKVDLQCGECTTQISQLPFQPTGDRPVYCLVCLRKRRDTGARAPRQLYDVDVKCAECTTQISQLPFQPKGTGPIYCYDCNKQRRR